MRTSRNEWTQSIVNHLYWSTHLSPSGEVTVAKWTSLLNHLHNKHNHDNQLFPKCLHQKITRRSKKWLKSRLHICSLCPMTPNSSGISRELAELCQILSSELPSDISLSKYIQHYTIQQDFDLIYTCSIFTHLYVSHMASSNRHLEI